MKDFDLVVRQALAGLEIVHIDGKAIGDKILAAHQEAVIEALEGLKEHSSQANVDWRAPGIWVKGEVIDEAIRKARG